MAETAVCISPYPVIIITGTDNCLSFSQVRSIMPSPSGRRKSDKTMSYADSESASCADTIPVHHLAISPFFSNHFCSMVPKEISSSTINIFPFTMVN